MYLSGSVSFTASHGGTHPRLRQHQHHLTQPVRLFEDGVCYVPFEYPYIDGYLVVTQAATETLEICLHL